MFLLDDIYLRRDSITWKKVWIKSEYESAWCIIEKFKYANNASLKDIYGLFGSENTQNKQTAWIYKDDRDLYKLSGLESKNLMLYLGEDIKKVSNDNITRLISILPKRRLPYLRQEFYYCPICIQYGFHSILHQVSFIDKCPYHLVDLQRKCPKCGRTHTYSMSIHFFSSPFRCSCGYSFLGAIDDDYSHTKQWEELSVPKVQHKGLNRWLRLKRTEVEEMRSLFFDGEMIDKLGLNFYYYIIQGFGPKGYREFTQSFKPISITNTFSYHELTETNEAVGMNYKVNIYDPPVTNIRTIFKSIARFLRQKVLIEHQDCIEYYLEHGVHRNRYIDNMNKNICPYAYAYAKWRYDIENLRDVCYVHRIPKVSGYYENWSEPRELYEMLYRVWKDYFNEINAANLMMLENVYTRIVSELILNHYVNLLKIANEFIKNDILLDDELIIRNEKKPFYTIKLTKDPEVGIILKYWIPDEDYKFMSGKIFGFSCPAKAVKKTKRLNAL